MTSSAAGEHDDKVLDLPLAATAIGMPESTLRYWRHIGAGPKSFKIGRRIKYMRSDLDAFIDECRMEQGGPK